MTKIIETKQTRIHECADGAVTVDETTVTNKIDPLGEPDYIKIYTRMWCEFNEVPQAQRALFLELALRMTYACTTSAEGGQIVATGGPNADAICNQLHIKKNMYQKGLRILCDCGAIKHVAKGWYQINANYAGRGEWKYNPARDRGGIEDICAKFKFKTHDVDTTITWADDGTAATRDIRENVGAGAVIKRTVTTPSAHPAQEEYDIPGQLEIKNIDMEVKP